MKKRLLSVALILSMLASLLMVGITGPVSAAKDTYVTKEATYDRAIDLSKELTPSVNLTFDGEAKYGIPLGRYTKDVAYVNNYAKVKVSTGWIFFGKNGSVGQTTVKHDDTEKASTALSNVYKLTKDNTYSITFKYKFLAGATVTSRTFDVGIATDPTTGPAQKDNTVWTNNSTSGLGVVWKVNGETQTGTLTQDTDWQTVTVSFKAVVDGYFGMQCGGSVSSNQYFALDDVKIYDYDAYYNSKFQNKLTFDNGGFSMRRLYSVQMGFGTENGNNYGIIPGDNEGVVYFSSAEDGKTTENFYNNHSTETGRTSLTHTYKRMFKFEPGKSYEVTFKYRYAADQVVTVGTTKPSLRLMSDPGGQAHNADDLLGSTSWAKDVVYSGLVLENEPSTGKWQDVKITFTVKTWAEALAANCAKVRDSVDGGYEFDGAYFGIKGDGKALHIDDYEVKELVNYRLIALQTDNVYHDMEDYAVGAKPDALVMNNNGGATVVDSGDGHGKVLQMTGNRGTFTDSNVFERGRKYYISFDAKTTDNTSKYIWTIFADGASSTISQQKPRYILTDATATGGHGFVPEIFKFYVNGKQVDKSGFKLSGEWQRFGIVVDFTNEAANEQFLSHTDEATSNGAKEKNFFNKAKNFYFGIENSWYDNFRITAVNTMDDAVPTSDISYVSKEIYHDMETYGGFYESEAGKAHIVNSYDEKYGQVMEITAGGKRIGFTDSNIITAGKKYYISFDAKTTNNTNRFMWLMMCTTTTTNPPRFIVSDTSHNAPDKGATNLAIAENGNAFRYYINDEEVIRDNFKLSGDWRKYTLVIDTSDPDLLAKAASDSGDGQISGLFNAAKYFYFGTDNAWFDNFRMVEVSETAETISKEDAIYGTEVSCREESTTANGDYVSAGLRFKSKLPNGIVAEADEIGFVAAPSSLANETTDWYKLENGVNQVARTAIVKDDIRNYVYATDGDNTYYQLVFTGLSDEKGKTAYNRRFSAVMYTKLGNEYKYYPLGEASYYQVGGITHVFNFDEKSLDVGTIASLDYKIVYNAEDYTSWVLKNQIDKLKQTMNNKGFGIEELDLRADTTIDAGDYEIIIGNTNRGTVGDASVTKNTNRYAIRIAGSKIYVLGGSTYALQSAVYELETMILAGKITEKEGSYLDTAIINATSEYKLVWQSEFDDPNTITYDSNNMASIKNWRVDPITVNTTNTSLLAGSQAFAVSDSETVRWDEKGYLILRATRKDNSTIKYEDREDWSGNENLKYKHQGGIHCSTMEFNYGYVEMRAKIPDGKGLYSSFWLSGLYNGTTPEVEIDIFESGGRLSEFVPNIHWWNLDTVRNQCSEKNKPFFTALNDVREKFIKEGSVSYNTGTPTSTNNIDAVNTWVRNYGNYNVFYPKPSDDKKTMKFESKALFNEWHTVGLLWTDEVMEFYCDGVLYHSRDIKDFKYPDGTHAFDNQFENIIGGFNLGWNGRQGNIDESTMTWDEDGYLNYVIDYFRLYQIDKNWRPASGY